MPPACANSCWSGRNSSSAGIASEAVGGAPGGLARSRGLARRRAHAQTGAVLPIPDRHPDDATLAWFGPPAFQLVDQPALRIAGWCSQGSDGRVDLVAVDYYLADRSGRFSVMDERGIGRRLRGRLFSEAPGATTYPGLRPERAALAHHLGDVVVNDRINAPGAPADAGSPGWLETTGAWRRDVRALEPSPAELDVDGRRVRGIRLGYGGYTGVTVDVAGRVVTLVLHDDERPRVDVRVVTRPE